jgi:hypothetical protein
VGTLDASQLLLSFHLGAVQFLLGFHLGVVQSLRQGQFARRALLGGRQLVSQSLGGLGDVLFRLALDVEGLRHRDHDDDEDDGAEEPLRLTSDLAGTEDDKPGDGQAASSTAAQPADCAPAVAEDKKFHKRADVVLSGMRKLRAALTEAASSSRPSPGVIVALSDVRRRYDAFMERAAAAPGSSLGQQLYVTRIHAKLSAQEVANGAGLRADLLDELEAGASPTEAEAAIVKDAIDALGGVPGTEHHEYHEPEQAEPVESHVNGWDESLVADYA